MSKKMLGNLELNRIYQRDVLEGLKMIPSESCELAIVDPPYNIGIKNSKWDKIDNYTEWCEEWIKEVSRILKPNGQMFVYGSVMYIYMSYLNVIADKYLNYNQHISWCYTNGTGGRSNTTVYPARSEHLEWFVKGENYTFNVDAIREQYDEETKRIAKIKNPLVKQDTLDKGKIPFSWWLIYRVNPVSKERQFGSHPSMKPLELCDRIIKAHSNEGDNILIPFCGSGSECVSASINNRNFISFELESEYIEIANKRLDNLEIK